ncbi:MAG: glycoside hydrolase family 2 protein [Bacteroidales bacterium]|nr:glycoside hydrolase family 2 protein [Bacteroidales bacterium]
MSRIFFFAAILSVLVVVCPSCEDVVREDMDGVSLDGSWLFVKADSSMTVEVERQLVCGGSIAGSERVVLPHSGSMAGFASDSLASMRGSMRGNCYYYRKFMVPPDMKGKRMSLFFEGAVHHAEVWTNGVKSMVHYGNMPFVVDFVPTEGENNVVVKLDSDGAICNNVWLVAKDSLSITNAYEQSENTGGIVIDAHCVDGGGLLSLRATVRNSYSEPRKARLTYRILDHNGKEMGKGKVSGTIAAGTSSIFADSLLIAGITPWDIDNPWLYSLDASLECGGSTVDTKKIDFGYRNISITDEAFTLNGRERMLHGVGLRSGYPLVGVAVSGNANWRDAYKIKRGGFDLVIPSGYMVTEQFLSACDYYGLLVAEPNEDSYSCIRGNHPCIVAAKSGDVNQCVYGCDLSADIAGKESELLAQSQDVAAGFNDIVPRYWSGTFCTMFDGESGNGGVMSENRMPKFSYYFCQSQRDYDEDELRPFADPVCVIASFWIPGVSKGVRVYGNCHQVELFVDGVSVGRKSPEMTPSSVNLPHPSFYFDVDCNKPGTLKAFGYDKEDRPIAESVVSTPGTPVRLKIVLDESGTHIGANDIVMVHCYVLDGIGNTVVNCTEGVEFAVTGTAQLLSPTVVKCEAGVATAMIRTGMSANDFAISAQCRGMYTVTDR